MKRFVLLLAASLALFAAHADAASTIGVVLMHGKTGTPSSLARLAATITAAGYAVQTPEMCWSQKRIFDKAFPDCMTEVDAAAAKLKAGGATMIVIGGTSQGAVAAMAYGASHMGLAGIIAMAPAADPLDMTPYPKFAAALKSATALVAAGKGDTVTSFDDLINGMDATIKATPKIYLSFHGPDSPVATMHGLIVNSLPKLSAPFLWIAGTKDPTQMGTQKSFAAAPTNKLSQYATVVADHAGTPDESGDVIVAWLAKIAAK